ncbi:MAG: hypothetical protein JO283_05375 [Bradyrhizobium sp.]|nr:hypothetical protein [Bradyrhizobium sp.]
MRGSLGEKIGEGAFSGVHAWAPGQVVKLFKAGVPQLLSRHKARVTRAVFAANERHGAGGARRGRPGGALRHRAGRLVPLTGCLARATPAKHIRD